MELRCEVSQILPNPIITEGFYFGHGAHDSHDTHDAHGAHGGLLFCRLLANFTFAVLGKCVGEWETVTVTGKQLFQHSKHKTGQKRDPP